MRRAVLAVLALVPVAAFAASAGGFLADFGPTLREECPNPEGIAVDPGGFVYTSSFAFAPVAHICVVDHAGRLLTSRTIEVAAGPTGVAALLGMLFVPADGLYVTDFADGVAPHARLLRVDRRGRVEEVASGFAAPNAIAMDRRGNLYVSDSFAGNITRLRPDGSGRVVWASDPLLTTAGTPPFGANGLAFDAGEEFLYVANTGDDTVLRIPVLPDDRGGAVQVFARGVDLDATTGTARALDGADGIAFDVAGNLWVCANQADEIQVLAPGGEIIARYRGAGAAALDFPASLAFDGDTLYLTNLSLDTGGVNSKLSVMTAPIPGVRLVR
jgi:sugar lactone lactonase YvrE